MTRRIFLGALLVLAAACTTATTGFSETASLNATVTHSDLEGGFWYLKGDDNVNYDPTNLPSSYQTEGKRVKVKLKFRPDLASTHQFGTIVEILEISALTSG